MNRSSARPTMKIAAAVATSLLLPLAPPTAGASDATGRDAMKVLYDLSGLASQVDSTADLVNQGLAQQRGRIDAATLDGAERALRRAYAAATLEEAVLADLAGRYDERKAEGVRAWLRSPLGGRIARLEAESATTEGARAMEEFAVALQQTPPRPERLALEQRFEEAMGSTESMVELTLATSLGIAIAMDAALPPERRSGSEKLRAGVAERRRELRAMLRPVSLVGFLFTYRELSDAEIESYVAFAETDAGRWYVQAMKGALVEAIDAASLGLADGAKE